MVARRVVGPARTRGDITRAIRQQRINLQRQAQQRAANEVQSQLQAERNKAISDISSQQKAVSDKLTNLTNTYNETIARLQSEGKLTSDIVRKLNKELIDARIPLVAQFKGYSEALLLAQRQGVADINSLRDYASKVATYQQQISTGDVSQARSIERERLAQSTISSLKPVITPKTGITELFYNPKTKEYFDATTGKGVFGTNKKINIPKSFIAEQKALYELYKSKIASEKERRLALGPIVIPSDEKGKLIVRLPNDEVIKISDTGTVNIDKRIAGTKNNLVFFNGRLLSGVREEFLGEVTRPTKASRYSFERVNDAVKSFRGKLNTSKLRGNISPLGEILLFGAGFVSAISNAILGYINTPKTISYLLMNPSEIKKIPSSIARSGSEFGDMIRLSPSEAFGVILGEYVVLKGTNYGIDKLTKLSSKAITRLNPKFVGSLKTGEKISIRVSPNRVINLEVVGRIPKQKLARQIALQGKKINAISSQADDIFSLVRRKRIIRKPIPGEANFNRITKNLLKKFDAGSISKKELIDLDLLIKSQGGKGLLERSFFADPSGKIRPSRLGVVDEKKLGFLDYLSEDISIRKAKPQIFVFEDIVIERFPKYLRRVASKIKKGKTLNKIEANALIEWQLKQSNKFKPLGFISGESEVTLAPGEIIKKVKRIGLTEVNGRKIPIIKVKIYKPKGIIKKLLNKLDKGELSTIERSRLDRLLRKETGIKYGLSSSPSVNARYVPIKRFGVGLISRISSSKSRNALRRIRSSSNLIYSITPRKRVVSRKSPRKISSKRRTPKSPRKSTARSPKMIKRSSRPIKGSSKRRPLKSPRRRLPKSPRRPGKPSPPRSPPRSPRSPGRPGKPPRKQIIIRPKGFKLKRLSTKQPVYYVVMRRRGKLVKLNVRPLILKDAKDYLSYRLDTGLSRSAWFEPIGMSSVVIGLPNKIRGYFNKVSRKLRPYKINLGRKIGIRRGYIEKRKYVGDTKSEIRQLQASRRKRKVKSRSINRRRPIRRSIKIKTVKRKVRISPARRRQLIRQLRKARRVRMKNIKKRKFIKKRVLKKTSQIKRKPTKKRMIRRRVIKRAPVKKKKSTKSTSKRKTVRKKKR